MSKKVLKRCEVTKADTWNLQDIFLTDNDWLNEYEQLKPLLSKILSFKGKLHQDAKTLLNFFELQDDIDVRLGKLYSYANCSSDVDTANSFYQDLRSKAVSLITEFSAALSFAKAEIAAMDNSLIESFFAQEENLCVYRRSIYSIKRRMSHILSDCEEKLLAGAGEMADAPDTIAGIFRDADLKFPDVYDSAHKAHPLTNGTFVPLLESSDRVLRESAFNTYYDTLGGFKNTIASTLDAQFKTLKFYANARKYPSTLTASLDVTEVPEAVYRNLITAVHANLDKMYRYVALRKRLLGVDALHMYDVYTPIVKHSDQKIDFNTAKQTVLEALKVLGEDYTDILKEGFANRWIDIYENQGKRSGAYCSGNARPHPYVLLNHKDNLDSMFTLAHEMGHALHSVLSQKNQPVSTGDYGIFVAEVASTVNEILLMRYLLNNTDNKKEKAYLINHFLDQFKGTVYRQTMFAEFELKMGEFAENSTALTADLLCDEYLKLNKLYFGDNMVSDERIALEWARIPHFFYNYYVFQYATGFCAAAAIAERILSKGKPAADDYKKFLSSGSSNEPIELLKIAGVDLSTAEPINEALSLFGSLIEQMENLV